MNSDSDYRASLTPEQRELWDAQAKARMYCYAFWTLLGWIAVTFLIVYRND